MPGEDLEDERGIERELEDPHRTFLGRVDELVPRTDSAVHEALDDVAVVAQPLLQRLVHRDDVGRVDG